MMSPVVAFFLLGLLGGRMGSDPEASGLYDTLTTTSCWPSAGRVRAGSGSVGALVIPVLVVVAASGVAVLAYQVLRRGGKLAHPDAASISAHYGSVSVVTYAVGSTYLAQQAVDHDGYMSIFLVFLEFPAIIIGVLLARGMKRDTEWRELAKEVLFGKAIVLLLGALVIGWVWGREGAASLIPFFEGLFKGFLALFLLGMG